LPWQLSFFFLLLLHFNSRECPSLSRKLCNSLAKPLKKSKKLLADYRREREKNLTRFSRHRIHPHPLKYERRRDPRP
jgi:hypothetical protein